jgi:hypothetical protein
MHGYSSSAKRAEDNHSKQVWDADRDEKWIATEAAPYEDYSLDLCGVVRVLDVKGGEGELNWRTST